MPALLPPGTFQISNIHPASPAWMGWSFIMTSLVLINRYQLLTTYAELRVSNTVSLNCFSQRPRGRCKNIRHREVMLLAQGHPARPNLFATISFYLSVAYIPSGWRQGQVTSLPLYSQVPTRSWSWLSKCKLECLGLDTDGSGPGSYKWRVNAIGNLTLLSQSYSISPESSPRSPSQGNLCPLSSHPPAVLSKWQVFPSSEEQRAHHRKCGRPLTNFHPFLFSSSPLLLPSGFSVSSLFSFIAYLLYFLIGYLFFLTLFFFPSLLRFLPPGSQTIHLYLRTHFPEICTAIILIGYFPKHI